MFNTLAFLGESLFVKEQDKELLHSFHYNVVQIKYDNSINYLDYLDTLDLNSLTQVGFFYHYKGYYRFPFFKEVERKIDTTGIPIRSKYHYFSDLAIQVFRKLKGEKDTLIIDLVSCRLNGDDFKQEVERIEQELGVDIRYSVDETGNRENGGNWVMESDDVNIKDVYFTDAISQWTGVLTGDIGSAIRNGTNYTDYFSYDSTTKTIKVLQSFQWSVAGLSNHHYIELQENEIFDGQGHTIDLSGIANWRGLISVSSSVNNSNKPTIKNIGILGGNLNDYAGYIIKALQKFFNVMNCYSTGDIGYRSGGIVGNEAGAVNGNCSISNCFSTGDITAQDAGGIVGSYLGSYNGVCNISNCYSTGDITDTRAGGITGNGAGNNNGICDISNCYSTGVITGSYAGGITGGDAGQFDGNCHISNCYSTGDIIGNEAGGIVGFEAGSDNGNCNISNCYSTGDITGQDAGGITGSFVGLFDGICNISNCIYNSSNIVGIFSSITQTNNSNNLYNIDNTLYTDWSSDIWQVGDDITLDVYNSSTDSYNSQTLKLPILNVFKNEPWLKYRYTIPTDKPIFIYVPLYRNLILNNNSIYGFGLETNTPQQFQSNINVISSSFKRYHSLFLLNNKTVVSNGWNSAGQLGNNSKINTSKTELVEVSDINNAIDIRIGLEHSLVLLEDKKVVAFGSNEFSQLGNRLETSDSYTTPINVLQGSHTNPVDNIVQIACGDYHSVFLNEVGIPYTVGRNDKGQLGNGSTNNSDTIVNMTNTDNNNLSQITKIEAGGNCTFCNNIISGKVYACGENDYGQLGIGNTTNQTSCVFMKQNSSTNLTDVVNISTSGTHTLILKRDGRVLACGLNNYGQLGNLDFDNQMYPVNMIYDFSQVINAVSVYAGENYSLVLLKDNTLLASGNI